MEAYEQGDQGPREHWDQGNGNASRYLGMVRTHNYPSSRTAVCRIAGCIKQIFNWPGFPAAINLVTVVISMFTFFVVKGQLDESREEQRAWIGAPTITPKTANGKVMFQLAFKNIGHKPTKGLHIDADLSSTEKWHDRAEELCARGRQDYILKPEFKFFSIFPGGEFEPLQVPTGKTLIYDYSPKKIGGVEETHIVGCVLYGNGIKDEISQTIFVAPLSVDMDRADPDQVTVRKIYTINPD